MSGSKNTTEVKILDRSYLVACQPEERENLRLAAARLSERIQKLKKDDKPISLENLAVIAALNLANDLVILEQATAISTSHLHNVNRHFDQLLLELDKLLPPEKRIVQRRRS